MARNSQTPGPRTRGGPIRIAAHAALALSLAGCATPRTLAWEPLFDGVSTRGWRNVGREAIDPRWRAVEGALTLTEGGGGDIATDREFGDFELELEWRISQGGNSGIFYRAGDSDPVWKTAVEMQVLDDAAAEDRHDPKHRAGSVYDLYAPAIAAAKPAGEFNRVRIVARGGRVEHWLNGREVAAYDMDSQDWKRRVAASKFAAYPGFGVSRRGRIALQDHGDPVQFRNIRIRPL